MSSLGRAEAAEQTLLVGNLESRVREEILYELFLQAGPLTKVMICEDKEGKPQSFGYVCFKHKVSVPYAKALLDGICLYGRPITVQYWRGNSSSPQLDSCTDGFEHHIDLESPADRHPELSGNHPFPLTPLPVNNSLLHDHPGFQEVVARRVAHLGIFPCPCWNALFHINFKIPLTRFEELADVHAFTVPTGTAITNIYQIEMKK